ncbi:MAG: hypothetical protein HY912_01865 [Desulfomonile tiedjei]|uniref:Uncharacterized protein n=1 Tax=Desulfomonile tiedjei TaxID=2358 RepID=A0A9D6V1B1_9BACT|nr:hypothetical protein [Desulfomonile tiedjei]
MISSPFSGNKNPLQIFALVSALLLVPLWLTPCAAQQSRIDKDRKEGSGELAWEIPGRISIYDLQFGAAALKDNRVQLVGDTRTFNADQFPDRLTLLIRFSYVGSRSDNPLKFMIKLPNSRQYEETVNLSSKRGNYSYHFTIHRPSDFLGNGSVYIYYGFSIVDVLDFTIVPGS